MVKSWVLVVLLLLLLLFLLLLPFLFLPFLFLLFLFFLLLLLLLLLLLVVLFLVVFFLVLLLLLRLGLDYFTVVSVQFLEHYVCLAFGVEPDRACHLAVIDKLFLELALLVVYQGPCLDQIVASNEVVVVEDFNLDHFE